MSKKPISKKPVLKPKPPAKTISTVSNPEKNKYLFYGTMIMLFLLSMLVLSPVVSNDFINTWDDGVYVINNQLLQDLSWSGMTKIFTYGDEFQKLINNYHPLTTISLALNYRISGLSPAAYHATNLFLHALNTVLVFLFVFFLSRRKIWPAIISGLLFAVHPMHVESVAWVSERKDVLYTAFFMAGLITYMKYLEDNKLWKLGLTLLLFIFSCLSKAMAVSFPLILLLIDYFQHRRFTLKMLIEKIPFFIIALIIGLMSVHLQSLSAINKFETFSWYQRVMHASYGFISYILKFIYPSGLSAFYPYPAITATGILPFFFRIAPYVFIVIAGMLVWVGTRKGELSRTIVFGFLFYFFSIALVLQFLSVGKAIMADRYTYIPYIGLSIIPGMVADYYFEKKSSLKYPGFILIIITLIMSTVFSFMTFHRTKVWTNDIALWTDALGQYPDGRMNFIYEKRARQYLDKNQYEAALADYQVITANDPRDENALESIGRIYGRYFNDLGKAMDNLQKAYAINPKNPAVLKSLGVVTGMKGNLQESLVYLLQAYETDKTDTNLLRNISQTYKYMGFSAKAQEFDQLIRNSKLK